jgi:hypothetical protein
MLTRYSASLRLPTMGYTVDSLLRYAQLIRRISRPCSSFGAALRQSISTFPEGLDSPCGLPSAVFDLHRPRCCASGQPSVSLSSALPSLRFSTFPKGLDSVNPKNSMLTRYSASLRLTRSLPLSSPCGLPSAVYLDLSQRSRFC